MREQGIVLEVHGAEAVVQLEAGERSGPCCACAALGGENRHLQARTSLPVQVGERRDAASIVLGFAALAALFGFAAFIDRLVRRKTALKPAIVEILGPPAEVPAEACTTTNL